MLGVAPTKILPNLEIPRSPEALQIACDLHRAPGRRKEMQGQRHPPVTDGRCGAQSKDFLNSYRQDRGMGIRVVDGEARPGGDLPVGGCHAIQEGTNLPWLAREQGLPEVHGGETGQTAGCRTHGEEPAFELVEERVLRDRSNLIGEEDMQKCEALADCLGLRCPGQRDQADRPYARAERGGNRGGVGARLAGPPEFDLTDSPDPKGFDPLGCRIPTHFLLALNHPSQLPVEEIRIQRGGPEDPGIAASVVDLNSDEPGRSTETLARSQPRSPARGELIATPTHVTSYAIGPSQRTEDAQIGVFRCVGAVELWLGAFYRIRKGR
jgi:hypothetical protein